MFSGSIIRASKKCNNAAPEGDGPPKVYTSSESNIPASAPSPGILGSVWAYANYADNYLSPKQTNLLQKAPLLEVPSELVQVINKQKEEDEKEEEEEEEEEDFLDAPSFPIGKFSLGK